MSNRYSRLYRVLLGVLAIVCCERTAAAQSIDEVISPGRVVRIEDRDGIERTGTVLVVASQFLELKIGRQKETIPAARLRSIKTPYRDPIGDGARTGALRGLLIGAVAGAAMAIATCTDDSDFLDFCSPGWWALSAAVGGGYGAGIGAAAGAIGDALRPSYRVVWRAPVSSQIAFSVTRLSGNTGVGLSFRW